MAAAGADLLEEHLGEIRNLRQRLEESICINDRLREQLEHRLSSTARGSGRTAGLPVSGPNWELLEGGPLGRASQHSEHSGRLTQVLPANSQAGLWASTTVLTVQADGGSSE